MLSFFVIANPYPIHIDYNTREIFIQFCRCIKINMELQFGKQKISILQIDQRKHKARRRGF
ncbi:hypothetical protein EDM56_20860 [Brevibacillus fluminis]|uniref:Uncharacterized protein n=1 Tax=Brevibacillus fluminis TaxID=511487 RepID=A0A3M8DAF4_9BACL|nr:hypothetical protein EDM56_20860 [Brevibacillus fluminis]